MSQGSPVAADSVVQETQFSASPEDLEEAADNGKVQISGEALNHAGANGHDQLENADNRVVTYGSINGNEPASVQPDVEATTIDVPKASPTSSSRALAPDLLRGFLMVLQAIDHCSVSQGAWRHGVALESEADGTIVNTWNDPIPWTARMFTHLCAPGFFFLLGMGVVYFGRSRSKLGWSSWQMVRHFTLRAVALAAVNQVFFTLLLARGRLALLNIVLIGLAVDYLLAGLIWIAIDASEKTLCGVLEPMPRKSSESDTVSPLLPNGGKNDSKRAKSAQPLSASWHIHNIILLALIIVSLSWNQWLSPHHGHCPSGSPPNYSGPTPPTATTLGPWFDFWFLNFANNLIISPFPPFAWLSASLFGLLYGRVVLARPWRGYTVVIGNVVVAILLMILFILTRLLRFGNLSEDCLRLPEHIATPDKNQYLTSFRSFFYVTKYPPSMSYMALTLSLNVLLLGLFASLPEKVARRIPTLLTFGQSALFFYVLHLLLYSGLGSLAKTWFGHDMGYPDPFRGGPAIGTQGRPAVMWVTWAVGLAILWPLCRWYGRFKAGKEPNSVWRFF